MRAAKFSPRIDGVPAWFPPGSSRTRQEKASEFHRRVTADSRVRRTKELVPMIQNLGGGWVRFTFEEMGDTSVFLVGDFNGWAETSHPMEPMDDCTHQTIIKLPPGEYEFKYKAGCVWFNDPGAHKYVANCWGSENSVAVTPPHRDGEEMDLEFEDLTPQDQEGPGLTIRPSV